MTIEERIRIILRGHANALERKWKNNLLEKGVVEDIVKTVSEYADKKSNFEQAGRDFIDNFRNEKIRSYVHSHSSRAKDPLSLANKIRRKALADENPRFITKTDGLKSTGGFYDLQSHMGATDLTGVRILHLYKPDWYEIHKFIVGSDITKKYTIYEGKAHLSKHDYREYQESWDAKGKVKLMGADVDRNFNFRGDKTESQEEGILGVEKSQGEYTSVHYTFERDKPEEGEARFLELQVRSLMEESWGEMQHQVSYPHSASRYLTKQLAILKHAADLCDDIGRSVWEAKGARAINWNQLVDLAKSATEVHVATQTLQWTADQIRTITKLRAQGQQAQGQQEQGQQAQGQQEQGQQAQSQQEQGQQVWAPNWMEAHGNFIYYVPPCSDEECLLKSGVCDLCNNRKDVQKEIDECVKMDSEFKGRVSIQTLSKSKLNNLMSDRVYLRKAIYPYSGDPEEFWKEYDVYLIADSRLQSEHGDGEADRVFSRKSDEDGKGEREYEELRGFFDGLSTNNDPTQSGASAGTSPAGLVGSS